MSFISGHRLSLLQHPVFLEQVLSLPLPDGPLWGTTVTVWMKALRFHLLQVRASHPPPSEDP